MAQKPSIPKGTRDFSPVEMARRNYIFDTIKNVFKIYGYQPIETPAMENLSTLMGKYGEEGDKLLFKILNSGDYFSKISPEILDRKDLGRITSRITEKGLRYDLTVPFARYVVQHRNEIVFPFKRYQIQPVWRADRPQKGRYREFYQCDVDVIGSGSLLNEVELIQIIDTVFNRLNLKTCIKINNRKVLAGIADIIGEAGKITDITIAIDKIGKIGLKNVNQELAEKGVAANAIEKLQPILHLKGSTAEKMLNLESILKGSETGLKGINELKTLFSLLEKANISTKTGLDLTLARGLNYYTGAIIEVEAADVEIGSVCGGGRYDDLTGIFGLPEVSGVGVSFGAERIYDVLALLDGFPDNASESARLLFTNLGDKEAEFCLKILSEVRQKGINAELYPDQVNMKKQLSYANRKNIPFVALVGETEVNQDKVSLKNMISGEQRLVSTEELIKILSEQQKNSVIVPKH